MRGPRAPTGRQDDIAAAVAAITSPDRVAVPACLLIAMFPDGDVYRSGLPALRAATGLSNSTIHRWLAALLAVGLLSKEPAGRGVISAYRLHLPPRRRP